jgi:hypothetical protein
MRTATFAIPTGHRVEPSPFQDPNQLASQAVASNPETNTGEVLSPSQVRCFMDCQMRWWFKYGLKVPDPATGNMALGRAVHSALGENFAQKLETREDLPTPGVLALFREALGQRAGPNRISR